MVNENEGGIMFHRAGEDVDNQKFIAHISGQYFSNSLFEHLLSADFSPGGDSRRRGDFLEIFAAPQPYTELFWCVLK